MGRQREQPTGEAPATSQVEAWGTRADATRRQVEIGPKGAGSKGRGASAHHIDPALVLGADVGDGEDERVQADHDHGEEELG